MNQRVIDMAKKWQSQQSQFVEPEVALKALIPHLYTDYPERGWLLATAQWIHQHVFYGRDDIRPKSMYNWFDSQTGAVTNMPPHAKAALSHYYNANIFTQE